jgi:SAM-dependent methyltransferase
LLLIVFKMSLMLDAASAIGVSCSRMCCRAPRVQGVDRDPVWVEEANSRAAARNLADRFSYQVSVAEKLPFADATFDLVTCQTVLIHMPDPGIVVDEMIRVARPGGLVLAAEPNNIANSLILDLLSFHDPVDEILARVRLQLICERGKAALGEGNNSIGGLVPGLFAERGLIGVRVYLNDKTNAFLPPYGSLEERAMLEERADLKDREFWVWSREDTHRYFLAGGGREDEFDALWSVAIANDRKFDEAIAAGTYAGAGGGITYLIAGRKPEPSAT